jgi:hypothetical protein
MANLRLKFLARCNASLKGTPLFAKAWHARGKAVVADIDDPLLCHGGREGVSVLSNCLLFSGGVYCPGQGIAGQLDSWTAWSGCHCNALTHVSIDLHALQRAGQRLSVRSWRGPPESVHGPIIPDFPENGVWSAPRGPL